MIDKNLSHAIHDVGVVGNAVWSTGRSAQHWPARVWIKAQPRRTQVRTLRAPCGFAARLPMGPTTRPVAVKTVEQIDLELSAVTDAGDEVEKLHNEVVE